MNQPPPQVPVQIGEMIAGKYRVERVLGIGGMGVVVAAMHVDLLELRAIKLLLASAAADADLTKRFLREARAAGRLKDEHVAKVYDVGRLDGGTPYIVMEHLDGCDLNVLVKTHGPRPVAEAVTHVLQAIEGIAEAHAAGIVHRDLKPANLFLTTSSDGSPCVKVLDFGISKLVGPKDRPTLEMTVTSDLLGSPFYMSPEQMMSTRDVDVRTDIWSLGVILYKLITGTVPFRGETITQVCGEVLQRLPAAPSTLRAGLPYGLDAVVLRCLEKDRTHRYSNVAELAAALVPFGGEGAQTSAHRCARMLGVRGLSTPGLEVSRFSTQAAGTAPQRDRMAHAVASYPSGPAQPETPAPAASLYAKTGASWGQTAASSRSHSKRSLIIAGVAVLSVMVSAIGLVAFKRLGRDPPSVAIQASVAPPLAIPEPSIVPGPAATMDPDIVPSLVTSSSSAPEVAPSSSVGAKIATSSASAKPTAQPPGKSATKLGPTPKAGPTSKKTADPFGPGID